MGVGSRTITPPARSRHTSVAVSHSDSSCLRESTGVEGFDGLMAAAAGVGVVTEGACSTDAGGGMVAVCDGGLCGRFPPVKASGSIRVLLCWDCSLPCSCHALACAALSGEIKSIVVESVQITARALDCRH
jgi:hypothetical protein